MRKRRHLNLGSGPGPVPGLVALLVEMIEGVLELAELKLEVGVGLLQDGQQAEVGRDRLATLASSHLNTSYWH